MKPSELLRAARDAVLALPEDVGLDMLHWRKRLNSVGEAVPENLAQEGPVCSVCLGGAYSLGRDLKDEQVIRFQSALDYFRLGYYISFFNSGYNHPELPYAKFEGVLNKEQTKKLLDHLDTCADICERYGE